MEDLSLHILDIVENCINAKATRVRVAIVEDIANDLLTIEIEDNGVGMNEETLKRATDPFFTTRTTRRVGLGFSLLKQATQESNGSFEIESKVGKGTRITATFQHSHIDRKPLGDIESTITTLITGYPDINFIFEYRSDDTNFVLDTSKI